MCKLPDNKMIHFNLFYQPSFHITRAILLQKLDTYCRYQISVIFAIRKSNKTSIPQQNRPNKNCLANKHNVLIKKRPKGMTSAALALPAVDEAYNPCKKGGPGSKAFVRMTVLVSIYLRNPVSLSR